MIIGVMTERDGWAIQFQTNTKIDLPDPSALNYEPLPLLLRRGFLERGLQCEDTLELAIAIVNCAVVRNDAFAKHAVLIIEDERQGLLFLLFFAIAAPHL